MAFAVEWAEEEEAYEVILRGDPCSYCGSVATQVDHIVARFRGGADDWGNKTTSCERCNQSKSDHSLLWFLYKRAYPDRFPPQPRVGVRMRYPGGWDARVRGPRGRVLLGAFATAEEATRATEDWERAHPVQLSERERELRGREARVKQLWNSGESVKGIAVLLGITPSLVSGSIDRLRRCGEDLVYARGGPGKPRAARAGISGDRRGYSYNQQSARWPWLVQVSFGSRRLRVRFATEAEAQVAVGEFRARCAQERPSPRCRLEALRLQKGLTQDELAKAAGITDATVRGLENGSVKKPRRATREGLARVLGVADEELFADHEPLVGSQPVARVVRPEVCVARDTEDADRPWVVTGRYATVGEAQAALEVLRSSH